MRPLLDAHLSAHGAAPTRALEWAVYRDLALSEAADAEAAHEAGLRARGHSARHSSAADADALRARLDARVPPDSALRGAARRYLEAALRNPTWTHAQRARLVDRLGELAAHFAAHPPRALRGSPFSAALQPGGPPLVPRLSRAAAGRRAPRGVVPTMGVIGVADAAAGGS